MSIIFCFIAKKLIFAILFRLSPQKICFLQINQKVLEIFAPTLYLLMCLDTCGGQEIIDCGMKFQLFETIRNFFEDLNGPSETRSIKILKKVENCLKKFKFHPKMYNFRAATGVKIHW